VEEKWGSSLFAPASSMSSTHDQDTTRRGGRIDSGHQRWFGCVGQHFERTILNVVYKVAPLLGGCFFDPDPLGISKEALPRRSLRVAIFPAQEINELLVVRLTTLARKNNIETVTPHNWHALPAEAVVKVLFIPWVELVDAQLVNARLTVRRCGIKKTHTHQNPTPHPHEETPPKVIFMPERPSPE
jgi:hypothetical protein